MWLSLGLVGWNAAVNLVPLPDAAYVPANLTLAVALLWLGRRWGLDRAALGLSRRRWRRGMAVGAVALGVIALALLAAWALPATRPLLADQRVADMDSGRIAYEALVRIPLGTALAEEVVFRSVLLAGVAGRLGWRPAVWVSSGVFGLWHVGPSVELLAINGWAATPAGFAGGIAAAVVVTGIAGVALCSLRWWGQHLLAPLMAHIATNVLSLLAATAVLATG